MKNITKLNPSKELLEKRSPESVLGTGVKSVRPVKVLKNRSLRPDSTLTFSIQRIVEDEADKKRDK